MSAPIAVDQPVGSEFLNAFEYGGGVGFNGTDFVMNWQDIHSGTSATWGTLVDLDGGVRFNGRRRLTDVNDFANHGAMGQCLEGGTLLWVAPEYYVDRTSILRTTTDLQRLSRVSLPVDSQAAPRLACRGPQPLWLTSSALYFPEDFDLSLWAVDADGGSLPVDGGWPLIAAQHVVYEDLAYDLATDGTTTMVVWADGRAGAQPDGGSTDLDVWAAFVDPVFGVGLPYVLAGGPGNQSSPKVAWDGVAFRVLWTDQQTPGGPRDVLGLFGFLPSATPIATTVVDEDSPQLAFDGSNLVAVWRATVGFEDYELRSAVLSSSTGVGPVNTLDHTSFDDLHLAASTSGRSLVTYRDFHRGIHQVAQVLAGAAPAFPDAGSIDPGTTAVSHSAPQALNVGGGVQALLWVESGSLTASLVSAAQSDAGVTAVMPTNGLYWAYGTNGTSLLALANDFTGTFISLPSLAVTGPALSWGGSGYLTAISTPRWDGANFRFASSDSFGQVRAHTLSPSGAVVAESALGAALPGTQQVDLAVNATGTALAVWSPTYKVEVSCLADAGVSAPRLLGGGVYLPTAKVASSGDAFLVIYLAGAADTPLLMGQLVDGACASVGNAFLLGQSWQWPTLAHDVLWDGRQYVVAWVTPNDPSGDVWLVTVQTDGGVSSPVVVAAEPLVAEGAPSLSSDAPGHWLVASLRFDGSEAVSAQRAFYRWVQDDADAGTPPDGGVFDGGLTDGGELDGGASDGGLSDGGPLTTTSTLRLSCGCGTPSGGLMLLLALALLGTGRKAPFSGRRE